VSTQPIVNYTDDAQRRVACDTLCIQRKATLTMPTTGYVQLPAEVVRIEGIYLGTEQLQRASEDSLMEFLSAGSVGSQTSVAFYSIVGRRVYLIPTPSEEQTITLVYKSRPVTWQSDRALEVTGPFESLVDQLVQVTMQVDSGQTRLAADGMQTYQVEAGRLRRKAGAKPGQPGRVRQVQRRR